MALQGTIDAFPLVDVVQLLGASRKTGCLTLESEVGTGRLWVDDGHLVAAEHDGAAAEDPAEALVDLLRPEHGSFLFEPDVAPAGSVLERVPLLEALEAAGTLLEEWRTLTVVVPSPRHRPVLDPDPAENPVMLDAGAWRVVVEVAAGPTVEELAAVLGVGELAATRALADLVARGLVRMEEPRDEPAGPPADDLVDESVGAWSDDPDAPAGPDGPPPHPAGPDVELDEPHVEAAYPPHFPIDDLVGDGGEDADAWPSLEADDDDRFAAAQPFADPDAPVVLPPVDGAGWDGAGWDGGGPAADRGHDSGYGDVGFTGAAFDDVAFADAAFTDGAFTDAAAPGGPSPDAAFSDEGHGVAALAPDGDVRVEDGADLWTAVPAGFDPGEDPAGAAPAVEEPDGTDEILRQMSRLSPKAAEAIAAALGTGTDAAEDGDGFLGNP